MKKTRMIDRNYKCKICALCNKKFKPYHPRQKRCNSCLIGECSDCGKPIKISLKRLIFNKNRLCLSCLKKIGPGHGRPLPFGIKRIDSLGYIRIKTETGWEFEHRYIMGNILGRKLSSKEIVHHIDGNKQNNFPNNLILENDFRHHLETYHKHQLKNPPTHHFGKRKWTKKEYQIFNGR